MTKLFSLCVALITCFSCTSQRDVFTPKRLGDKENTFRRSYLTTASDLYQDLYFAHQALSTDIKLLSQAPTQEQLDLTKEKLITVRSSYNKAIAFSMIHGPLDYPYSDHTLSLNQYLFANTANLSISPIKEVINGKQELNKELLYEKHLSAPETILLGIPALQTLLDDNEFILEENKNTAKYLGLLDSIMTEQVYYLLEQWSPYEAGNFRALIQTRNQEQFLGWIYTSFIINHQNVIDEIKSSQKSLPVNDLNERLKALMNLWEGTYILNDKRQYLRVGLNTLMGSPEINNYFKTLEKSRGENNEKMALEALYALSNGIQRATEGTYDKNVQEQPYIIPNIKLHQLRTRRHYDKNAPFGENLK